MEYLVHLGFREEPRDLGVYLVRKGFAIDENYEEPGEKVYKSQNGEMFWYFERMEYMGIDSGERMDKYWSKVAPGVSIASEAEIRLGPEFVNKEKDLEKLVTLGKIFRDELNALLTVQEAYTDNIELILD